MTPPDLTALRAPDEAAAQERAWPAVREAFAARERVPVRRHWRTPVLAAAAVALVAAAATPPGQAVAGFVRDRIVRDAPRATAPQPLATRTPGRLLLTTPAGVWMLRGDGSGRLLGGYGAATWSPNGLFVGVARGDTLAAVEPDTGTVRWRLETPGPVSDVRWAPRDGFRIAYRAGGLLRVVNGDGTGDRVLARTSGAVAPAWRPGSHVLAFADGAGHLVMRDVDRVGARVVPAPAGLTALAYAPDGTLLAAGAGGVVTVPRSEPRRTVVPAPVEAVATSPAAPHELVALRPDGTVHRVRVDGTGDRLVATVPGATALAWSPDARTILVAAGGRDRWHLIDAAGGRDRVLEHVAGRLDPDGLGTAAFPALAGWCC
jgi:hypothetical protein